MNSIIARMIQLSCILLACGMIGASPATRPAAVDPLAPLANQIAEKAGDRSVVLVLRPDAGASAESPSVVAGIRQLVLAALKNKHVAVSTSDSADSLLRDGGSAGPPAVPSVAPILAAAKADLMLQGTLHRSGSTHKIAFSLMSAKNPVSQLAITLSDKSFEPAGDDVDLAEASITRAIKTAAEKMVEPVKTAQVKTLRLAIRPQSVNDAAPAAFEMTIRNAISRAMHAHQIEVKAWTGPLATGTLQPAAVAKLKDLDADSAVMLVSYAHRPGGELVTLSVVSAKAKLATESVGVDNWDVSAMPPLPVLNTRVLAYSESKKDTKVGNGECWTLAAEALNSAKAKQADGYTFGRKLDDGETIYPGDIMQFTEARFEGKGKNGGTWWMSLGSPNHTAVVRRVLGPTRYEILEQNPGPVKAATIDFKDLKSGKWEAWRPEAKRT